MRAACPIAILLLAASAVPSAAQAPARPPSPAAGSTAAATTSVPPVIACASLANLRAVLRGAKDDPAAALPLITDPKSDLGCIVLDRKTVTAIADHVALDGKAYECLTLQTTSVCQWTVAGTAPPVVDGPPPARGTTSPMPHLRGRR